MKYGMTLDDGRYSTDNKKDRLCKYVDRNGQIHMVPHRIAKVLRENPKAELVDGKVVVR